jgi:hypothetical protein
MTLNDNETMKTLKKLRAYMLPKNRIARQLERLANKAAKGDFPHLPEELRLIADVLRDTPNE